MSINKISKSIVSVVLCITLILSSMKYVAAEDKADKIPEGYTPIYSISDLVAVNNDSSGKYILMNDIDLTEATAKGGSLDTGNGWTPLNEFSGTFDGNGHRIKGMHIYGDFDANNRNIGLFSYIGYGAEVTDLGIVDVDIDISIKDIYSDRYVGALAGYSNGYHDSCSISKCFTTGTIKVSESDIDSLYVGGLIGNVSGEYYYFYMHDSYSTVNIYLENNSYQSSSYAGGLVGSDDSSARIERAFSTGDVSDNSGSGLISCRSVNGDVSGNTENIYYLKKGENTDEYAKPLTAAQFTDLNYFEDFDKSVWVVDPYSPLNHPELISCRELNVTKLEMIKSPTKSVYNQGDSFDISGAQVKVTYENGIAQNIAATMDMVEGYDSSKIGKQKVSLNYGGQTVTFDVEVKENPVQSVSISSDSNTVQKGSTLQLNAAVLPENASDKKLTWTVESKGGVVTVSDTGLVTGIEPGECTVTAKSANGVSGSIDLKVLVPIVLLVFDNNSIDLNVNTSAKLGITISPIDTNEKITWSSSDASIATVSEGGDVTGLRGGQVTITAASESGKSATCQVNVKQDISSFNIVGLYDQAYNGSSFTPEFQVTDGYNVLRNMIDYSVTYTNNIHVGTATVTVTGTGCFTGQITKNFQITGTEPAAYNGQSEKCNLNKSELNMYMGKKSKLVLNGASGDVKWSTSNKKIAIVNSSGVVTIKGAGKAKITASYGGQTYTCAVTGKSKFSKGSFSDKYSTYKIISIKENKARITIRKWGEKYTKLFTLSADGSKAKCTFKCKKGKKHVITVTSVNNGKSINSSDKSKCKYKLS